MTLQEQLKQALDAMSAFGTGRQPVDVDAGGQRLSCELTALDSLACAFERLTLTADTLAGRSSADLKKAAEQLSARLTYLLEPISPIETDAEGCVVQMRSNPPQRDSDRTSYYELLVARSGELSLTRYSRPTGQSRQVIPAHVTREVLLRLATDFSAAAAN